MDSGTPCTRAGLPLGSLATVNEHPDIPDGSLVRVVTDETDHKPAVEVLISTEGPPTVGDGAIADTSGEVIRRRCRDFGFIQRVYDIVDERIYYWAELDMLTPLNNEETDDGNAL